MSSFNINCLFLSTVLDIINGPPHHLLPSSYFPDHSRCSSTNSDLYGCVTTCLITYWFKIAILFLLTILWPRNLGWILSGGPSVISLEAAGTAKSGGFSSWEALPSRWMVSVPCYFPSPREGSHPSVPLPHMETASQSRILYVELVSSRAHSLMTWKKTTKHLPTWLRIMNCVG